MIQTRRMPNGMCVLTEQIPHAISVTAGIWVLRGSRHEPEERSGITHFVEHMFFKGTEKRNTLDISREIESVGGSLNAFTAKEVLCLYVRVLHSHLPLALDLLTDLFQNALFPEDEMEKERQVILQEISMVEDAPEEFIHELFAGAYWRGHPLGRSTLGPPEIIQSLSQEDLSTYASQLRDPSRILLSVAGNLDPEEVFRLTAEHFPSPEAPPAKISVESPTPHKGLNVHLKDLEQVHLCFGTRGFPYSHPKRYAYHVLNTLLGGGMSSRLFQEIREKRGLAYSVYSFQSSYVDAGLLGVYAGTAPESVDEVVELVLQSFKDLKNSPVSPIELTIAKEQLKGNLLLSTESTSSRMSKLAMNEIYFGKQLDLKDVIEEIDRVQEEDVLEISQDLFRPDYLSLTILGDMDRDKLTGLRLDF